MMREKQLKKILIFLRVYDEYASNRKTTTTTTTKTKSRQLGPKNF